MKTIGCIGLAHDAKGREVRDSPNIIVFYNEIANSVRRRE